MIVEKLKKGSILSETSFFIVDEVVGNSVKVTDDFGNKVVITSQYVEDILNFADQSSKEEKLLITKLAELFINSPRIAMTVAFMKKDTPKTKTAIKEEKAKMVEKFQNAKVSEIATLVEEFTENPIKDIIPGELRVMKGRHCGNVDDLGRVAFVDMEQNKEVGKDYDSRLRQVDPRTIQYLIVGNTKYSLK